MKEYKVVTVSEGDANLQWALNKEAHDGWRLVAVTKTATGSFTLFLERDN